MPLLQRGSSECESQAAYHFRPADEMADMPRCDTMFVCQGIQTHRSSKQSVSQSPLPRFFVILGYARPAEVTDIFRGASGVQESTIRILRDRLTVKAEEKSQRPRFWFFESLDDGDMHTNCDEHC